MSRGILASHEDPLQTPSLPNFKLAEKLGQGAFGSVYKALNWTTGETCAVKQIDLSHIARSELPDIMQEIDLLKNLHHSNIVQYRGYARTDSALYIILEYCENGSLAAIIKKFGRFPESLAGLYTLQVLQGLLYLHDQGVIHRDIKGSNILATKEGSIKLADFGVATRVGGPSHSAVVGSPYWMAPEVVDQSGATTASDIWSLGALVVELLTGKPPYHFLDPMPALFRIVNDDCPPLPQGASAVVRDFLTQCFQKDGNLRIGARKLLRHPWMVVAKKQQEEQSLGRAGEAGHQRGGGRSAFDGRTGLGREPKPISTYDETVQQVQRWNEALKAAPTPKLPHSPLPLSTSLSDENAPALRSNSLIPASSGRRASLVSDGGRAGVVLPLAHIQPRERVGPRQSVPADDGVANGEGGSSASKGESDEEKDSDNWDSDFEGGLSISRIEALEREVTISDEPSHGENCDEDASATNSLTIRPTPRKPKPGSTEKAGLETVNEDYSDLVPEGCPDLFTSKIGRFNNSQPDRALLRPRVPSDEQNPSRSDKSLGAPTSPLKPVGSSSSLSSFFENEADDYSDVFGKAAEGENHGKLESLQLQQHLSTKSWLGDEDSDDEDPFSSVNDTTSVYELDEHDLEANLLRDRGARQCALVADLLDTVESGNFDEYEVREAALQITGTLEDSEEVRNHFKKRHGTLIVVEALQIARSREILAILLRILNLIVGADAVELEKLALVGGCPIVLSFASKRYSREIRLETALFIGKLCRTSLLTLQMFVSCRGLRTLVDMLDENYDEGRDFVWMAVDGVARVFEMNGPAPRNDFCRLLAHEGLLEPLSSALISVCADDDDLAESAKAKIVHILLLFAQSDHKVKQAMATRAISLRLVKAASLLEADLLAVILKTVKNLSMLPGALDVLQNAGTIELLIGICKKTFQGRIAVEIQNHALHALFNLCRLSKVRQEEAASFGAIPILKRIVLDNSPLKQFALPILCDFAHLDSRITRKLLWKHDVLKFYLQLLSKDPYWINAALEAICSWFYDEGARVETCLMESDAVDALVRLFCSTKGTVFETMLESFHKILRASSPLSSRLATQSGFCKRIVERIELSTKAVVRLNLLRIAKTAFDSLDDRRDRERVVKILAPAISRVAEGEKTILASQLAKSLSAEFVAIKETSRRSLVPRRGVSEGSAANRRLVDKFDRVPPPSSSPAVSRYARTLDEPILPRSDRLRR